MILCLANNNCVDRSHGWTTIFPTLNFFCGMWCGWIFVKSRKKSTCATTIVVRGRTVWKSNADVRNSPWFVTTATSTVHSDDVHVVLPLSPYYYSYIVYHFPHYIIGIVYCYRRFYSPMHLHFLPTCYLGMGKIICL